MTADTTTRFNDYGTITLSGTKTQSFELTTADGKCTPVLAHINGLVDITIAVDNTVTTTNTTAFKGLDQHGKVIGLTGFSNQATTPGAENQGGTTVTMDLDNDGVAQLKVAFNSVLVAVRDTYTIAAGANADGVAYEITCKKVATGAGSEVGSVWTITAVK